LHIVYTETDGEIFLFTHVYVQLHSSFTENNNETIDAVNFRANFIFRYNHKN